jgi:hypothetical protein
MGVGAIKMNGDGYDIKYDKSRFAIQGKRSDNFDKAFKQGVT